MANPVDITRYPNRRLYDRSRKKYVTVGDIEAMVLGGQDVRVRDSKTDEDLTRVILTQIILERHPERMKMFPLPFLHAILRADQMALDWLTVYLGQAKTFMDATTPASAPGLVPGMDFWQSFIPSKGKHGDRERSDGKHNDPEPSESKAEPPRDADAGAAPGGGVQTEQAQTPQAQTPQAQTPQAQTEQEMVTKLAEMERRIKQLEGGPANEG